MNKIAKSMGNKGSLPWASITKSYSLIHPAGKTFRMDTMVAQATPSAPGGPVSPAVMKVDVGKSDTVKRNMIKDLQIAGAALFGGFMGS